MTTTPDELKERFWKALASDRTVMLGVPGEVEGHFRPMTAQVEDDAPPIWFFAGRPTSLVDLAGRGVPAQLVFVGSAHGVFARVEGRLSLHQDRATIDRLWNPFIAAWFEGKDDPKLALLRFDPGQAEIWKNENNLLAGLKLLLGVDPKKDFSDDQAEVDLG